MVSILVFSHAPTTRSSVPVDHCLQLWLALKANGSTNESASHWPRPLDPVPEAVDKPCLHDVTTPRNDVAQLEKEVSSSKTGPWYVHYKCWGLWQTNKGGLVCHAESSNLDIGRLFGLTTNGSIPGFAVISAQSTPRQ